MLTELDVKIYRDITLDARLRLTVISKASSKFKNRLLEIINKPNLNNKQTILNLN